MQCENGWDAVYVDEWSDHGDNDQKKTNEDLSAVGNKEEKSDDERHTPDKHEVSYH
jgi:hypothetical protein